MPSAQAEVDEQGKYVDPAAGVAIILSKRMRKLIDKAGHVGTRITWVRIRGPMCPLFFIAVYIPPFRKWTWCMWVPSTAENPSPVSIASSRALPTPTNILLNLQQLQ